MRAAPLSELHRRLSLAIAGGLALSACGGRGEVEPESPAPGPTVAFDPSPAPTDTPTVPSPSATAAATAVTSPTTSASATATGGLKTCPAGTKREMQCLAKNVGPPTQVPNPAFTFDAAGCVSADALRSVCNGVHDVLSGPQLKRSQCCYEVCTGLVAPCGRPLTVESDDGRTARVATHTAREDWIAPAMAVAATPHDAATRDALATAWLSDALQEHASIASFSRFVLELLSVGAPAELVQAAQQAGLDEIEHARLCFALASAYGPTRGPGPLPSTGVAPRSGLAAIAAAAAEEACCGETYAALAAARAAQGCSAPSAARALARIAEDEARHAELGWRFVAWALARGDERVRAEVARGFERGLATLEATRAHAASLPADPALRAAGRLTGADLADCAADGVTLVAGLRAALETPAASRSGRCAARA